jgi:glycosyltransferase involved in cell wall biosynthesis
MRRTLGVLITYHNERELLRECLESLCVQRDVPEEVLIYDDASDFPACDYVPREMACRIIRGEVNRGPAYGRNVLLRASRSDYIHFHDADDLFHPEWCPRVRQVIEESNADVILTEICSMENDRVVCDRVLGLDRLRGGRDLVRFCIEGAVLTPAGTYRRSCVVAIGGYREQLWQSEDFDFHIRLAASGVSYKIIREPLVIIRLRASGRSRNQVEVWASAVEAITFLSKELPSDYYPILAEKAAYCGSVLFRLGAHTVARKAFQLAHELGPPTFRGRRALYRGMAKLFGPLVAERMGSLCRRVLPEWVRRHLD